MSTPSSLGAKPTTAAELWKQLSDKTKTEAYWLGYDAATAKLREELHKVTLSAKDEAALERARPELFRRIKAILHQQPSATCPDCKQSLSGDDMVDREMHGRCHSQGEPSATKFELHHGQMCELCSGCEDDENFDYCRACGFTKLPISFHPPSPQQTGMTQQYKDEGFKHEAGGPE